ncbi:hypothetical protein [Proteiniborus sp.]|uniref:hypothetical protein n=1 Tax=Proteiniborus sp. TaxID=2079015 RepID=UPI0033291922
MEFKNDKCILEGDNTGPISARNVLSSKEKIDIAVLEVASGNLILFSKFMKMKF